jgi:hypothetical protein
MTFKTPRTFYFDGGSSHTFEAPDLQAPVLLGGFQLRFQSFSDGGPRSHAIEAHGQAAFMGASLTFNLAVDTAGTATSTLTGDLKVDTGDFFGVLDFGSASLGFDASRANYRFQGDSIPPDGEGDQPLFRLYCGSGGVKTCNFLRTFAGGVTTCICGFPPSLCP